MTPCRLRGRAAGCCRSRHCKARPQLRASIDLLAEHIPSQFEGSRALRLHWRVQAIKPALARPLELCAPSPIHPGSPKPRAVHHAPVSGVHYDRLAAEALRETGDIAAAGHDHILVDECHGPALEEDLERREQVAEKAKQLPRLPLLSRPSWIWLKSGHGGPANLKPANTLIMTWLTSKPLAKVKLFAYLLEFI